jgi:RNA polymerase sigma factor (sigma-70 family)
MSEISTLVARAANREEPAWGELVARHNPMLRSIARGFRLTDQEAADAAQTTWLRLVLHITRLREPDHVAGWLASTMRHECLRLLRLRGREDLVDDWARVGPAAEEPTDSALLRAERARSLWRAVDRLPPHQRRLLLALSSATEPSYKEVAAAMSIPIGSIGPTRARALSRLRDLLADDGLNRDSFDLAA